MKNKILLLFLSILAFWFFLKPAIVQARCDIQYCTPPNCSSRCNTCSWCTGDQDIIGEVNPPADIGSVEQGALGVFIQRIIWILIIGAGIYALINLILAGYAFMSAGDDPKKIQGAWAKIWQTLLGLAFAAGAFVIAAIIGQLIFGEALSILKPEIPSLK